MFSDETNNKINELFEDDNEMREKLINGDCDSIVKLSTDYVPTSLEIKEAIEPIIDKVDPIYRKKLQDLLNKVEKKILYRTILDEMATATYNQDNQTSKTR